MPGEPDTTTLDDDRTATNGHDPASILGHLAEVRQKVADAAILPMFVPRWGENGAPAILVRYRPVDHKKLNKIGRALEDAQRRKKGDEVAELEVNLNADILIDGCEEVVAILDGVEYSMRQGDFGGTPTRFDDDLALSLGFPQDDIVSRRVTARQVVRRLFITDADVIMQAQKLGEWSGYQQQDAADVAAGE